MINETLESIFNYKKTKFLILEDTMKPYIDENIENINLYIDVWSIISRLYQPNMVDGMNFSNDTIQTISSQIINIAAHYRNYIWTRLGKYSTIYFFYSNKEDNFLKSINKDYKSDIYTKIDARNPVYMKLNKIINKSIDLAKLVITYLPNIYFIDTKNISPSLGMYYFNTKDKDEKSYTFILSSDKVQFQLALNSNTTILHLKGDETTAIDKLDLISNLFPKKKRDDVFITLVPEFYVFILGFIGEKKLSLNGLPKYGISKTIKLLEKLIDKRTLSNIEYDLDTFLESIKDSFTNEDYIDIYKKSYFCMDLKYQFMNLSKKDIINVFESNIVNRIDGVGLRNINDTLLGEHYIMLEELMMGEEYE